VVAADATNRWGSHTQSQKRARMSNVIDFQVAQGPLTIPPYLDRRGELAE